MSNARRPRQIAQLDLTDTHYGKKTSSFNKIICFQRLDSLLVQLAAHREMLARSYVIPELVLNLLGDHEDGAGIYAAQGSEQDVQDPMTQAMEFSTYMVRFVKELRAMWGIVRIRAVCGNHGRNEKNIPIETNWDRMMYNRMKDLLASEAGIFMEFNDRDDLWIQRVTTLGWPQILMHGHIVRSFQGIPYYGFANRIKNWSTTSLAPFYLVHAGHFHTTGTLTVNRVQVLLNGTLVSNDSWALREFGHESRTEYSFHGVSEERPITWNFNLDVSQQKLAVRRD